MAVTGDGRSTTGVADRAHRSTMIDAPIRIRRRMTFRTTHCSSRESLGGVKPAPGFSWLNGGELVMINKQNQLFRNRLLRGDMPANSISFCEVLSRSEFCSQPIVNCITIRFSHI